MSACEECWAEASWRAALRGGVAADYYRDLLVEHETDHMQALAETEDERGEP